VQTVPATASAPEAPRSTHSTQLSATLLGRREKRLTTGQAAAYIGVSKHTLEIWRSSQRHSIPFIKVGRLVHYNVDDLDAWLTSRTIGAGATP